jgi:predicted nucleotidyltransferase
MTELERDLVACAADLRHVGARFAVVGGLAVSVRASPRLTRDVDVAVAVGDDRVAESLVAAMRARGYDVEMISEHEPSGRLATVRLTRRRGVLDVLFASSGIEHEIVDGADELDVTASVRLPIASTGHLIAMKLLARDDRRRPADADDLEALRAVATEEDWTAAADAVGLIEERGFARGRNLSAALAVLRSDGAW